MSPTGQGVDHRQVQRELGEVAVQLQDPLTLTTTSIRVSWNVSSSLCNYVLFREGECRSLLREHYNVYFCFISILTLFHPFFHLFNLQSFKVDRQSQFVQGYRLFYRPSGGTWLLQDINSPSERSTILTNLLKGTEYEIKIRPYFDEFQGKDSRIILVRMPEEGMESGDF